MAIKRGKTYYSIAHNALKGVNTHPGFKYLKQISSAENGIVLDVGCGEGSRLDYLVPGNNGIGIEINEFALKSAKEQFPRFKFYLQKGSTIPVRDNISAITYSTFVLEHTEHPKKFLDELIRVTRPGGILVVLCPNFGSPNRRSPNSTENPITKLVKGFLADFTGRVGLSWTKVIPKNIYSQIDDDTTVEPYILSLISYLKSKGLKKITASSLWELEQKTLNPRKLLFLFLGKLGVFPFKYWGPQIFVSFKN